MLVIGGLFAGGIALAFVQSVGFFPASNEHRFTLAHYRNFLSDPEFRDALLLTIGIASLSTLISAVTGFALALSLRRITQRSRIFNVLVQVPIAVPHLVVALLLLDVIAPGGLISRMAYAAGIIKVPSEFPVLVNDRYGIGIVIAYALKEAPFVAVMVLAVLVRLGDEYDAMARTLGASAWQRLRYITVPMVAPALISSALVVFAFICGAFEIPLLLGRQYPAMLPVVAQRKFMNIDLATRPDAIAVGLVIACIAALLAAVYLRFARVIVGTERPVIF
jgi:putative spermidine/putrescine transport system permease protein